MPEPIRVRYDETQRLYVATLDGYDPTPDSTPKYRLIGVGLTPEDAEDDLSAELDNQRGNDA